MNMNLEEYTKYVIYRRRERYLGSPFIKNDTEQIDMFLAVVDNYIKFPNYYTDLKKTSGCD